MGGGRWEEGVEMGGGRWCVHGDILMLARENW